MSVLLPGPTLRDTFDGDGLSSVWQRRTYGSALLRQADGALRCVLPPGAASQYADAQITDYERPQGDAFRWRPPLRLSVRAWASAPQSELIGTAGFGFWNEPFLPVGRLRLRLPRAVWFFFGAPPHNMALARDVPGHGWKAATLDAGRPLALALLPLAPLGFLLMRVPALYRRLWPVAQRAIGVSEALLPVDLSEPHTYSLDWLPDGVTFRVDRQIVHEATASPRGPLGLIAWMDNQYAIITPQGRIGFGVTPIPREQWLALDEIAIESLSASH